VPRRRWSTPGPSTTADGGALADRKPFLLRLDRDLHAGLEQWAAQELRSLNAQIEYLLRRALREAGRDRRAAEPARPEEDKEGKS
jgi:hypothetical protein